MRPILLLLLYLLFALVSCGAEPTSEGPEVVHIWENGAPGFEDRAERVPVARDWWVREVHDPTLTVFAPDEPNGTAVIVVPGGGHHSVVFNAEGRDPGRFLAGHGVTAFALTYRLAREDGSDYDIEDHAAADLRRAMRWVRAHADEYDLDPARIGVMGFSAGGELVNLVTYGETDGDTAASDTVEQASARPDFQIQIYPGPLGLPDRLAQDPPPAFFLAAFDDTGPELTISRQLDMYRAAGVPAEVHILARGGHAFNMGDRSKLKSVSQWPERLADWMADSGWLEPRPSP